MLLVGRHSAAHVFGRLAMRTPVFSSLNNGDQQTRESTAEKLPTREQTAHLHSDSAENRLPLGRSAKAPFSSVSGMLEELSDSDRAKRAAAFECGRDHIKSGQKIGVGSGTTSKFMVDYLEQEFKAGRLHDIQCVPTSFLTRQWLLKAGIPVSTPEQTPELDIAVDGADELDRNFACIKGGGGCLTQEKIVQTMAAKYIIIAQNTKHTEYLGKSFEYVPVEVVPFAYAPVKRWIEKTHHGRCELRMSKTKCGAAITDNNCFILDWYFPPASVETDWAAIHTSIACRAGVVETGLFLDVVDHAYLGETSGHVEKLDAPKRK